MRMIGEGRPFALEFLRPRLTKIDDAALARHEMAVNSRQEAVKIDRLQVQTRVGRLVVVAPTTKEAPSDPSKKLTFISTRPVQLKLMPSHESLEPLRQGAETKTKCYR